MSKTIVQCELTDTYGEANYAWVRSATFELGNLTHLGLMRKAKAALGISGLRCKVINYGDMIELRPYRSCTVAFITFVY